MPPALQRKCYAHHHKAIRQAKALHPHQGEGFLCEVEAMLRAAIALQKHKADLSLESFRDLRQARLKANSRSLPHDLDSKAASAIGPAIFAGSSGSVADLVR
jgi:hypothetical protein